MTATGHSTRRKLSLLQLAEELGNVSKACKLMGYHRFQTRPGRCRSPADPPSPRGPGVGEILDLYSRAFWR